MIFIIEFNVIFDVEFNMIFNDCFNMICHEFAELTQISSDVQPFLEMFIFEFPGTSPTFIRIDANPDRSA